MQIAIALHQSCWLRLSVSRMILRGDHAAEKQSEHERETIFHCKYLQRIDVNYHAPRWRPVPTRASGSTSRKFAEKNPEPQAFTAITSRYSDETTVSSSPPRLYADHSASSSSRSFSRHSSNNADARL